MSDPADKVGSARPPAPVSAIPIVHVTGEDAGVRECIALVLIRRGWAVRSYASDEAVLAGLGPEAFGCLLIDPREPARLDTALRSGLVARGIELPMVFVDPDAEAHRAALPGQGKLRLLEQPWYQDVLERRVRDAVKWHAERHGSRTATAASPPTPRRPRLTRRETEVLELLDKRLSSKEIGRALEISYRTVDVHRTNILRKLGMGSIVQLRERKGRAGRQGS